MNDILIVGDTLPLDVENDIAEMLTSLDRLKEQTEAVKEKLKEEMIKRGLVKIESPKMTITYVAPTTKETFKTKDFRKDNPDLYDKYVSISNVKDYVKVAVK